MARPCKEGMDYFPHDTDAVNDEKIEMLRSLYGNNGYAFYFIMLERIYRSKNFELDVSDAETREEIFQILSRKMMLNLEEFQKILNTAFKYKCFDKSLYEENGIITSEGIKKRAASVVEKRTAMKKKYESKKESDSVSEAETTEEITQETISETPQSKEKESKEKKSNIHKIKYDEFVSMTEEEYKKLIDEYGEIIIRNKIVDLNLWKGSKGKKTKSDYMTLLTWLRRDNVKPVQKLEETQRTKTREIKFVQEG